MRCWQTEGVFELLKAARPAFVDTPFRRALFAARCLLSALEQGCSDKSFSAPDATSIAAELRSAAAIPDEPMDAVIQLAIERGVLRWSCGFNPHFAGTGGLKRLRAEQAELEALGLQLGCEECADDEQAFQDWLTADAKAKALALQYKEVRTCCCHDTLLST